MSTLHSKTEPYIGRDWAGSLPQFPVLSDGDLSDSVQLEDFRHKRLLFGCLDRPGIVHVYRASCTAGGRLRVRAFYPVLPYGGSITPSFAVVAQSLPFSADIHQLPISLPGGYSAVVAQPPVELTAPMTDRLTGARYYSGPVIDTRTLVSGYCFVVVWSPKNQMGKYILQVGHQWPLNWLYWLRTPIFWWKIRGWYEMSRARAYLVALLVFGTALTTVSLLLRRK